MTSIFDRLEIFNSAFSYDWFEDELFNQIADFLQHLQQCLHLYCESKLLDLLIIVFIDFVSAWFDDQSKFISLHDFDIVLTKTFFSSKSVMIQSISAFESICEIFEKSTNSCSSSSQKQQKLKIIFEVSKVVKRDEFKKISKAEQTVKSTSTFQNIDIFDSTTCNESEFELYSEIAIFLQHFQQCQHLYRKSDLLNLLSKCLCDFAFEWFKIQSKFISLRRFNKALAKTFSEASSRRVSSKSSNFQLKTLNVISKSMKNASNQQVVQMICKICRQNFNFNEELYEHIRNHEALKLVKNFHLLINAVNLVCKIKKKSFVTHVSSASFAKSQKSIFESATTFKSIILLKRSNLSLFTLDVVFIRMKNESFQCFSISSQNSIQDDVEIDTQKSSAISSSLLISTTNFKCEITKRSTTCRHCKQTFKFKELFRKHKREQHAKKFVINSSLRSHAFKSVCKAEKKSAIKNVTTLFALQELQISDQKIDTQKHSIVNSLFLIDSVKSTCKVAKKSTTASIEKFSKFTSEERAESRTRTAYLFARLKASRLNLSLNTFVTISETMKNASIQEVACARATCRSCKQNFNFNNELFEHIREHEILKRVNDFHFSINTLKSICESEKKSAIACSSLSQKLSILFATSRNLVTDTRISLQLVSSKDSNLSIATLKITLEDTKTTSNSQIVCTRTICKRCEQIFNFNNKFHEHLRQNHARISIKSFDLRALALKSTYKIAEKSTMTCSSASHASFIFFAISRSQIFSAKMSSRSVSHKDSHLSIARLKITSKSMKKLSVNCSLTSSFTLSHASVRNLHESHIQTYFIVNDLSRMFHEKFKSFDLRQHHNRRFFSQSFDLRQFDRSCSIFSKKFYLTIENLFEMFDEKFRRKSLSQNQKNVSSREFFSKQSRIIVYFKFAINRKSSINQNSKSSKSKSLNQHMIAKFIRIAFSENLFEKSIELS